MARIHRALIDWLRQVFSECVTLFWHLNFIPVHASLWEVLCCCNSLSHMLNNGQPILNLILYAGFSTIRQCSVFHPILLFRAMQICNFSTLFRYYGLRKFNNNLDFCRPILLFRAIFCCFFVICRPILLFRPVWLFGTREYWTQASITSPLVIGGGHMQAQGSAKFHHLPQMSGLR